MWTCDDFNVLNLFRYILLGASLFKAWENWDYLDGSYFCFISLSSIGFGDLVPGTAVSFTSFHFCKPFDFTMHFNSCLQQPIHNNKSALNEMNDNKLFISCTIIWCGFSYMNNAIFMASLCGGLMMFMNIQIIQNVISVNLLLFFSLVWVESILNVSIKEWSCFHNARFSDSQTTKRQKNP